MAKPPAVTLDPASPIFRTADAAANAVSRDFAKQIQSEQAAVVFQHPDGTYRYSTVAPQDTHDAFALRAQIPQGHKLAGIVHSHPGTDADGQVFSPHDLDVSNQLKLPSFIRFNNDNSIRKYVPGVTATQNTQVPGNKFGVKTAAGDALAQDPPPDDSTQAPSMARRDDPVTSY